MRLGPEHGFRQPLNIRGDNLPCQRPGRPAGRPSAVLHSIRLLHALRRVVFGLVPVLSLFGPGCGPAPVAGPDWEAPRTVDELANTWVKLVFALGRHDPLTVDLVFLEPRPDPPHWPLAGIRERAALLAEAAASGARGGQERRVRRIAGSARALEARAAVLLGERVPVREQLDVMFGLDADFPAPDLERLHFHVERQIPGIAPLVVRVRRRYERRSASAADFEPLLRRALLRCRDRALPAGGPPFPLEPLGIRWITPAEALARPRGPTPFYRFRGAGRGELEMVRGMALNPAEGERLACHEGVPGHHLQAAAADAHYRATGWPEAGVVALYDPRTAVFESLSAVMERLAPEAPEEAALRGLEPVVAWILSRYLDGELERLTAMRALDFEALAPDPHALLDHADRFGGYALVRPSSDPMFAAALEPLADPEMAPAERFETVVRLVEQAMSPRELVEALARGGASPPPAPSLGRWLPGAGKVPRRPPKRRRRAPAWR